MARQSRCILIQQSNFDKYNYSVMKQLRDNFKKDLKNKAKLQDQNTLLSQDLFMNRKIVYPQKLKILVLSGNDVVNQQLQFIKKCTSLLKLDISNNNITKISKKLLVKDLKNLRVIHLHNNRIDKVQGLQGIFSSQSIQYLTLQNNPVMKLPKIEHLVTNMIGSLRVLNKRIIHVQERSPQVFNQRKSTEVDDQFLEKWKSTSSSEAYYIRVLQLQINYIENVWIKSNPIVYIQRIWKAIVAQNRQQKSLSPKSPLLKKKVFSKIKKTEESQQLILVRKAFNDWKQMIQSIRTIKKVFYNVDEQKDKEYLTYPLQKYKIALRNLKVRNVVRSTVNNTRQTLYIKKMASLIKNALYQRSEIFNRYSGFYYAVGIDQDHKIYFNKSQRHVLQNILLHIQNNFQIPDILNQCQIKKSQEFLSIRMVDPQTYENKKVYSILTYLMWPSSRVIFLKKRKVKRQIKHSLIKIKPLRYMQNKNKVLTSEQIKKSIEVFKRVDRFAKNQYQESLHYMYCQNEFIMKMLIRYVFYYNQKKINLENIRIQGKAASLLQNYQQPFVMYSRKLLERTAAAVRIQQNWRTYITRKQQSQNVSFKMRKNRAVLRIQRFCRDLAFNHRLYFHKHLQSKLFTIQSSEILIHRQIYFKLKQLCQPQYGIQLYQGLRMLRNKKRLDLFWKMNNYAFPPSLVNKHFSPDKKLSIAESWNTDIYDLLHLRSKVEIVQYRNTQFYRFTFENIKQARFRVSILALMTYRIYGKKFLWPLTIESIDQIQKLIQQYQKFKILKDITIGPKEQQNKAIKKTQIKDVGPFLFSNNFKQVKPNFKQINLQFYQKKYQNFPIKFIGDLLYWIPQNERIPVEITQEQRRSALQQRLTKDITLIQQQQDIQSNQEHFIPKKKQKFGEPKTANLSSMENSMNVTKIDKKKLSFYDIGGGTEQIRKDYKSEKQKLEQTQKSFLQTKKQWIVKTNQEEKYRKQLQKQRKKNQISSLRTRIQAEKNKNQSFKSIREMERNQNVRKQVQKIKAFKSRASSTKKQTESDFIQQGNFVMQQQLKMVIMRNKIKQSESIKQSHTMNLSIKKQQQRFGDTMSLHSRQQSKDSKSQKFDIPMSEIQGNQSQIRNTKISFGRRTRTHSIGAHIRDPAMVHGVFPEEYYPIEHKGNIKLLFPPL